jgi:serine/threonine protein kinase/tetratricopeptide (TPR) repeat protein
VTNHDPTGDDPTISDVIGGSDSSAIAFTGHSHHIPVRIGPYRIRGVIASGGMGTVYEAIQENPRRRVALKVVREGLSSDSARRRFEYETEILGRLRHPGIAQIYEAGTQPLSGDDPVAGLPYFAMEFIAEAQTLSEWSDRHELGVDARVELFLQVCDALEHGHQRGIIHRDLKPGNILVDAQGQPKVIDYGVARTVQPDLVVRTLRTEIGQLIGTIQYMSPEQCAGESQDVDTRSDVYSLGLLLYQLLCKRLPYDVSGRNIVDAIQIIREETGDVAATAKGPLPTDLTSILGKSLEKDRDRRYGSAGEFAEDLRRYLKREPVLARPQSMTYQLAVFTRRNTLAVTLATLLLLVLVGGVVTSTIGFVGASRTSKRLADEVRTSHSAVDFLQGLLLSPDPEQQGSPTITFREVLDQHSGRLDLFFAHSPLARAAMKRTFAATYLSLDQLGTARTLAEEALQTQRGLTPVPHDHLAETFGLLADIETRAGSPRRAVEHASLALDHARLAFHSPHPLIAEAISDLGVVLRKGDQKEEAIDRYEEAEAMLQSLLKRAEASSNRLLWEDLAEQRALLLANLGAALRIDSRLDEARDAYEESLEMFEQVRPDRLYPNYSATMALLGRCLQYIGEARRREGDTAGADEAFERGLSHLDQSLEIEESTVGVQHTSYAGALMKHADLINASGRNPTRAEAEYREVIAIRTAAFGEYNRSVTLTMDALISLLAQQSRFDEAIETRRHQMVYRQTNPRRRDRWMVPYTRAQIGWLLADAGRTEEAIIALESADAGIAELLSLDRATPGDQVLGTPGRSYLNGRNGRPRVIERLAQLYENTDRAQTAALVRARLDQP